MKNSTGDEDILGNDNTIFVVKDEDNKLTVYTGIANLPNITSGDGNSDVVTVSYMKTSDSASNSYASLVYIDASKAGSIDDTTSVYDLMFVLDQEAVETGSDNETVVRWNALVNGESQEIIAKVGDLAAFTMYYKVQEDGKGRLSATTFNGNMNNNTVRHGEIGMASGTVSYAGETLSLGGAGFRTDSNTTVYLITDDPNLTRDNTADADYQVYTYTPSGLGNLLRNYDVTGADWFGVTTSSDSTLLTSVYLYIESGNASPVYSIAAPSAITTAGGTTVSATVQSQAEESDSVTVNITTTGTALANNQRIEILNGTTVLCSQVGDGSATSFSPSFTMPAGNVSLTMRVVTLYTITDEAGEALSSVTYTATANVDTAAAGEIVTVTVKNTSGAVGSSDYVVKVMNGTTELGRVTFPANSLQNTEKTFTFSMPASNVTLDAKAG